MATIGAHKNWKAGDFIISEVNSEFLTRYKIDMQVKDFKSIIHKLEPSWIGLAGGRGQFRKVNVYNIKEVKNYIKNHYTKEQK